MYTLNQVERRSSSSSSDEEVKCENHTNRHCKYLKIEILIAGELCYFHVRICKCGRYKDKTPLLQCMQPLCQQDGVDIHYKDNCEWTRNREVEFEQVVNKLNLHCVCRSAGVYQQSDMNCKHILKPKLNLVTKNKNYLNKFKSKFNKQSICC